MAKKEIGIGDWVRKHQPGLWKITRVQPLVCRDPVNGKPLNKTLVFANRIATTLPRKAFSSTVCELSFVRLAAKSDVAKIEKNQRLLDEFDSYAPAVPDAIYNFAFEKPVGISKAELSRKLQRKSKITDFEIHETCENLNLELGYQEWTAQFVSRGHEVNSSNALLYSFERILT